MCIDIDVHIYIYIYRERERERERERGAQLVKNLPAMQENQVQSLGQEDPLEDKMATHSSILARRIPWTEEPGGLQSMGLQRVRHDWVTEHACRNPNQDSELLTITNFLNVDKLHSEHSYTVNAKLQPMTRNSSGGTMLTTSKGSHHILSSLPTNPLHHVHLYPQLSRALLFLSA